MFVTDAMIEAMGPVNEFFYEDSLRDYIEAAFKAAWQTDPLETAPKDGTRFIGTAVILGERRYGVAMVIAPWTAPLPHIADDWEIRFEAIRCYAGAKLSELDGWMPLFQMEMAEPTP